MQRHHRDELLEALATGREHRSEEAVQPRHTAPREIRQEEAVREPVSGRTSQVPARLPRTNARAELRDALASMPARRRAMLLHEVLGPPKAFES